MINPQVMNVEYGLTVYLIEIYQEGTGRLIENEIELFKEFCNDIINIPSREDSNKRYINIDRNTFNEYLDVNIRQILGIR